MTDQDNSLQFPSNYPIRGKFIVKNISNLKTIRIFDYPILIGQSRDILRIPGIGESDIRNSLLKGTLRNKIMAKEIEIVDSDIDLLQFNDDQKSFLQSAGLAAGADINTDQLNPNIDIGSSKQYRLQVSMLGLVNDVNTIFTVPVDSETGKNTFSMELNKQIQVYKNGVRQYYLDDYIVAETNGVGTGYNAVIFTVPPSAVNSPADIITADYFSV